METNRQKSTNKNKKQKIIFAIFAIFGLVALVGILIFLIAIGHRNPITFSLFAVFASCFSIFVILWGEAQKRKVS